MIQEREEERTNERETDKKWCLEDFTLVKAIGKGHFGNVFLALEKQSEFKVAIKIMRKDSIPEEWKEQVFHEIMIHSIFSHPHMIPLYTFFHDETNLYTVMEYASSNSLYKVMRAQKFKRFGEDLAAKYIYQVADALQHMHHRLYFHRDVKPENVLVDDRGNAKLADFGLASSSHRQVYEYCGTKEYMAPEVVLGKGYRHHVDHWALGVMTYELLVGRTPFRSSKPTITAKRIVERQIKFPKVVQPDAKDLILKLLEVDHRKRLPLTEVMNHKWIKNHYIVIPPSQ